MNAVRRAVAVVFDRDLTLGVGAKEFQLAAFAHLGVLLDQPMGETNRQRHQRSRFVAGEAEHHPLVAGPAQVHAHGDVGRLLVEMAFNLAGVGREAHRRIDVAGLPNRVPNQPLDVGGRERSPRGDLPGHHYPVGGDQRLARHPARRISTEAMIQNRVADLVRHLVRMAHGNRFAREQISFGSHDYIPCKVSTNWALQNTGEL